MIPYRLVYYSKGQPPDLEVGLEESAAGQMYRFRLVYREHSTMPPLGEAIIGDIVCDEDGYRYLAFRETQLQPLRGLEFLRLEEIHDDELSPGERRVLRRILLDLVPHIDTKEEKR